MSRRPVIPPIRVFWYGLATGFVATHPVILIESLFVRAFPWFIFVIILALGVVGIGTLWKIVMDGDRYDMIGRPSDQQMERPPAPVA